MANKTAKIQETDAKFPGLSDQALADKLKQFGVTASYVGQIRGKTKKTTVTKVTTTELFAVDEFVQQIGGLDKLDKILRLLREDVDVVKSD